MKGLRALILIAPLFSIGGANAAEHPPAAPSLNPTGRDIAMEVPFRKGERVVGEIMVVIGADDEVRVAATDIRHLLLEELEQGPAEALAALGELPVAVAALNAGEGVEVRFDRGAMELTATVDADAGKPRPIPFSRQGVATNVMEPATLSAFLNYSLTVNQDWEQEARSGFTLDLEGATRVGGIVLEAEASLGGSLNGFLCPLEARCREQEQNTLRRRGTRAVYDAADWNTRAVVGDTSYLGLPHQRSADLLGVSLAHDPVLFGKGRPQTTRTLAQLLLLDRSADLELIVNGIPMQRLKLQPGAYSLTDLPITVGANTVEAVVTYDNGEREVFAFNTLAHHQLLDAGEFTWGMTGGLPATWRDGERDYLWLFQGAANLRHGFTDTLTGYATVDTDSTIHNGGFGVHLLTGVGLFHAGGAASLGLGTGYAATLAYETLPDPLHPRRHLRLAGEYRSEAYRQAGEAAVYESDILFPVHDTRLRVSAVASHPLFWDSYATLTARYDVASAVANEPGAVSAGVDRWSLDLGVSRPLFDVATLTLTAGYGNDRLLSFGTMREDPEFRLGVQLYARLGGTSVHARHAFGSAVSSVYASHIAHTPSDSWQLAADLDRAPERGTHGTASASVANQWGEARVAHTVHQPQEREDQHRSQFQLRGAVAFADGAAAVGAPVRDGFAIISPHASIAGSDVVVGNREQPRATGSAWWPALVNDLPAYAPVQYPLDATDVPVGYSLGASHLSVRAPYRAGYSVVLGSDTAVTAFGTLMMQSGEPAALVAGHATSITHPDHKVPVFTNSAGRFAAEGVGAGDWIITLAGKEPVYRFTVPTTASGLHDAATLFPDGYRPPVEPTGWEPSLVTFLD